MTKNILRSLVALCLLGTVASFAGSGIATANIDVETIEGYTIKIQAAGANGKITGKGSMKLLRAITYPITVTSGSVAFSGLSTGSSTSVTLNGFVKPRTGASVPFVLIADTTGLAEMTLTITNGTTVTTNDVLAVGKVKITF